MRTIIAIVAAGFASAASAEESVFRFPLDVAEKIGSPHALQVSGRVVGSAKPPFASVAAVEATDEGLQSVETRSGGILHIVSARPEPGHRVRIEFFLNGKGESIAVVHNTRLPDAPPEPEPDERPYEHRALCEAATYAIAEGKLTLLPALITAGLSVDLPLDARRTSALPEKATLRW